MTDVLQETLVQIEKFYDREQRLHDFNREVVKFSRAIDPLQKQLNKFIYDKIILVEEVRNADAVAREVILHLFQTYMQQPELLPEFMRRLIEEQRDDTQMPRIVCDYIAGMTDPFAVSELRRLQKKINEKLDFDLDILQLDWMK